MPGYNYVFLCASAATAVPSKNLSFLLHTLHLATRLFSFDTTHAYLVNVGLNRTR